MASADVSLYDDPEVYDILHAPGTLDDVRGLERIERRWVAPGARGRAWLEPACGTARHLVAAAKRGRRVIGFDLNPAMVHAARAKLVRAGAGRRARVFVADMRTFGPMVGPGSVGLAFNLINTIRHLPSDAAMIDHLRGVGMALAPGGVYAVGISLSAYGLEDPSEDVWSGSRGRCVVKQVVQYEPASGPGRAERWERVISHLIVARGSREEHRDSVYRLRGYDMTQWQRVVVRAGLRVVGVVDERGDGVTPTEPGYAVWLLGVRSARRWNSGG
ncbi:MAG: class I SAM-dependent methyltransferase [Phycisphaeraceae bacterium]|nr:MAG: class I SAM-dependent methyltransferase [Phycisphaeraceae bacterium]